MRTARFSASIFIAFAAWGSHASAQGRDPAAAEALFAKGKELLAAGKVDEACAKLTESLRLDAATGTLLNLADCEERQGKLASAWQRFVEVRASLPSGDFRKAFVDKRIAELEPRVPRLTIDVPGEAPNMRILRRSGATEPEEVELLAPSLRVPLPVNPGRHELVVRAPGHDDSRTEITVAEGETRSVSLSLGARSPERVSAQPPQAGSSKPLGFVLLGTGGAALVAGAVTGIVTLNAASRYEAQCVNGVCTQEGLDAAKTGRTFEIVSPIALGVGAAASGIGLWLLLRASRASTPVALSPSPAPGAAGLSLVRSF